MKLILDYADIETIKHCYDYYPLEGVTTNPSILSSTGKKPYTVLEEIRRFLGDQGELHVQAVSSKAEDIVREAEKICAVLGKETFVKIPVVPEGLRAIKILAQRGFHITATGIYTAQQAYLGGKAGAEYAAPYVNRIDNLGADGVQTACAIDDIFKKGNLKTQVLAASFKNTQQVIRLAAYGVGAATVSPSVLEGMLSNAAVDAAVDKFRADFEKLCGAGATMLND
jgi:TalC/MipB family fructose-6-phosphate aldolase